MIGETSFANISKLEHNKGMSELSGKDTGAQFHDLMLFGLDFYAIPVFIRHGSHECALVNIICHITRSPM